MKVNTIGMRKLITTLVDKYPQCANDDKYLIAKVWEYEGWHYDWSLYDNLKAVSSPETIRRTRQRLQQQGYILPTDETIEARYKDFKEARWNVW